MSSENKGKSTDTESVTGKNGTGAPFDNLKILDGITSKDIAGNIGGKTEKRKASDVFRYVFLVIFAVAFIISAVVIAERLVGYKLSEKFYDNIRDIFYNGTPIPDESAVAHLARPDFDGFDRSLSETVGEASKEVSSNSEADEYKLMLSNLEALKSITPNAFGWIKIEGTRVDYPIVRGKDNEYYLDHSIDGQFLVAGSIFADYRNSGKLANNKNTVIYGHNMNNGTMFKSLTNFRDVNMFNNGEIKIYTTDGIFVYKPFAAYEAIPEFPFFETSFADNDEFAEFISTVRKVSFFSSNVAVGKNDRILTLMTCTNTAVNNRFVVHAVLEKIID